jgi:dTDP-glucose 4,6-dehydratase
MKIVVTGGLGFIGSHFVERVVSKGHDVVLLDNETYASNKANLSSEVMQLIKYEKIDIANYHKLSQLMQSLSEVDWVVNFAAESHVDRSIASSTEFFQSNTLGVVNFLEIIVRNKDIKFLQVSTDEVYGSIESGEWDENSPLAPNSPYSASKASAELACRAFLNTHNLDITVIRSANNFGPRQSLEKLIPKTINCLLSGSPIGVYGNGLNQREWVYVGDHVNLIESLICAPSRKSRTYNIGGQSLSNIDLITKISSLMGVEPEIAFVPDRLGHDWRYSVSDDLIREEFGQAVTSDLDTNLTETINWYTSNPDWVAASLMRLA